MNYQNSFLLISFQQEVKSDLIYQDLPRKVYVVVSLQLGNEIED